MRIWSVTSGNLVHTIPFQNSIVNASVYSDTWFRLPKSPEIEGETIELPGFWTLVEHKLQFWGYQPQNDDELSPPTT